MTRDGSQSTALTFSVALALMKTARAVRRAEWPDSVLFLELSIAPGDGDTAGSIFVVRTKGGDIHELVDLQAKDILAEDWRLLSTKERAALDIEGVVVKKR